MTDTTLATSASGAPSFDEVLIESAATAVAVAIVRAEESLKPDRLYEDPWAATFVARAQRAFDAAPGGADSWRVLTEMTRVGNPYRAIVVRVLDDVVRGFVAEGCRQLVVPGPGL